MTRRQNLQVQLEFQIRHDNEQIRISGTFPVPVGRALRVGGSSLHRGDRVGHCAAGVVLAMDAEATLDPRPNVSDHAGDPRREHAAVGVTHDGRLRTRLQRGSSDADRVVGIVLVPVEEVLEIHEHSAPLFDQVAHRLGNHGEVLLAGCA